MTQIALTINKYPEIYLGNRKQQETLLLHFTGQKSKQKWSSLIVPSIHGCICTLHLRWSWFCSGCRPAPKKAPGRKCAQCGAAQAEGVRLQGAAGVLPRGINMQRRRRPGQCVPATPRHHAPRPAAARPRPPRPGRGLPPPRRHRGQGGQGRRGRGPRQPRLAVPGLQCVPSDPEPPGRECPM